jgi:hypothetical protein
VIPQVVPHTEEEKRATYLALARLRAQRKTREECAEALGVSVRSVARYLADPLYEEVRSDIMAESKQRGHLLISEMIDDALEKLYRPVSSFVTKRYHSVFSGSLWSASTRHGRNEACRRKAVFRSALQRLIERSHSNVVSFRHKTTDRPVDNTFRLAILVDDHVQCGKSRYQCQPSASSFFAT